jgi:hypothetical protein
MTGAWWRVSVIVLAAGLIALLGWEVGSASSEEPPADVVADLERDVGPQSGAVCPDASVYSLARPASAPGPTVVGLGVFFQDAASLSDVDQTLDTDVYVVARWRDPQLADPARGDGSVECPVPEGRCGSPRSSRRTCGADRRSTPPGSSWTRGESSRSRAACGSSCPTRWTSATSRSTGISGRSPCGPSCPGPTRSSSTPSGASRG